MEKVLFVFLVLYVIARDSHELYHEDQGRDNSISDDHSSHTKSRKGADFTQTPEPLSDSIWQHPKYPQCYSGLVLKPIPEDTPDEVSDSLWQHPKYPQCYSGLRKPIPDDIPYEASDSLWQHDGAIPHGLLVEGDKMSTEASMCTASDLRLRDQTLEDSLCMEPKEVFVTLTPSSPEERFDPRGVWVKRCVGLCDYYVPDSECKPKMYTITKIQVHMYNQTTDSGRCGTYDVEEHVSCGCCHAGTCKRAPDPTNAVCSLTRMRKKIHIVAP